MMTAIFPRTEDGEMSPYPTVEAVTIRNLNKYLDLFRQFYIIVGDYEKNQRVGDKDIDRMENKV